MTLTLSRERSTGLPSSAGDQRTLSALLHLSIITAVFADFRDDRFNIPRLSAALGLLPEIVSALLFVVILLRLAKTRELALSPKYMVVGALIAFHFVVGTILGDGTAGTAVSGLRDYLRFLPLFLVPAVVNLPMSTLRSLMLTTLILLLMQIPIALYQRTFVYPLIPTGDVVRGTFSSGSRMSTSIIFAIMVIATFWIRKQMSLWSMGALTVLLMIPTLINETKATVFLFALGMVGIAFIAAEGKRRFATLIGSVTATALFVFAFASAYDYFYPDEFDGMGLIPFFLERGVDNEFKGIDSPSEVRAVSRGDSIALAFRRLAEDPIDLLVGYGIGNVTHPDRGNVLGGAHGALYEEYHVDATTYTQLLWEIGLIGMVLIAIWSFLVFSDARAMASQNSIVGVFSQGWLVVLMILPLGMYYKSLAHASAVVVPLTLFSGIIAAERVRVGRRRFEMQSNDATGFTTPLELPNR